MPKSDLPNYAVNFRSARAKSGLSQSDVARKLAVTVSAISDYEGGKYEPRDRRLAVAVDLFNSRCTTLTRKLTPEDFERPPREFNAIIGVSNADPFASAVSIFDPNYEIEVVKTAMSAKKFVHCSYLCRTFSQRGVSKPVELNDSLVRSRIKNGEISYHVVRMFFSREQIIDGVCDQIQLGTKFYCYYFPAPPQSVPVLNVRSFDDDRFVIGGFHDRPSSHEPAKAVWLDSVEPWAAFFQEYWRALWSQAKEFPRPPNWKVGPTFFDDLQISKTEWNRIRSQGIAKANA